VCLVVILALLLPICPAHAAPEAIDVIAESGWVVWLEVIGDCSVSGDFFSAGLTASILEDGTILTAGHIFWCDDDSWNPSDWTANESLYIAGRPIMLSTEWGEGPLINADRDLALLHLATPLSGGVQVAIPDPEVMPSSDYMGDLVWIIGFREFRQEVIAGRVVGFYEDAGVQQYEILVKDAIVHGFSGSPVLNSNGEMIGVLIAKQVGEPIVFATPITYEIIETLEGGK